MFDIVSLVSKSLCDYLLCLKGCVFFKAPARGLAAAPRDDGATLNRLLATFETLQEAELQEDDLQPLGENRSESLSETISDKNRLDLGNEQMADELDDGKLLVHSYSWDFHSCFALLHLIFS